MIRDISFGIVPISYYKKEWQVFVVEHKNGAFWSFPKGHAEVNESEQSAAMRELEEESALQVKTLYPIDPIEEHYEYAHEDGYQVEKSVVYFIAQVKTRNVKLDPKEILNGAWLSFDEAAKIITFDGSRQVCIEAKRRLYEYIGSNNPK